MGAKTLFLISGLFIGLINLQNTTLAEEPVYIADPNLKAFIEEELDISDPNASDMLQLIYLSATKGGISDLTGIEFATNLRNLYLYINPFSDISALHELTNLKSLHLGWNLISDISPLAGLKNLTYLDLVDNPISDISPLAEDPNLEYLNLSMNEINDISPLNELAKLLELDLNNNKIINIPALPGAIRLFEIDLSHNQINDISELPKIINLRDLNLSYNQINDISALSRSIHLRNLNLSYNYISDLSSLTELTELETLLLYGYPINIDAFTIHIPLIYQNNPGIDIRYLYYPDPPESISASDGTFKDKIHITWDGINSTKGTILYQVYRSDQETGTKTSICDWQTETSCDDTEVEGYTKYYYWVKTKIINDIGHEKTTDYSLCDSGWVSSEYKLNISSTEGGSVTTPGEGDYLYQSRRTNVTVLAEAEPNYYFTHWSGTAVIAGKVTDCTCAHTTVIVDDDYTLKANFKTNVNIIYVDDDGPADFNKIQAAIDYANNGDTIIVADGIYSGNGNRDIDFRGKSITVKSQNGPENCIIDCQGIEHKGFYIHDANSIVKGFTITNAELEAISCEYADPLIIECIITSNYSKGIYSYKANPIIADCIIKANTDSGIYCSRSNIVVIRCQIVNNSSQGNGGGIYNNCYSEQDYMITLMNSTITGNHCNSYGGGVYSSYSNMNIINCTISGNKSGNYGGGIYCTKCLGEINNSIITGNFSPSVNDLYISCSPDIMGIPDSTVNISHNIIGNKFNDFSFPYCLETRSGEWIYMEPEFFNPGYWDTNDTFENTNDDFWIEGDYHLKSQIGRWNPDSLTWEQDDITSPCIDGGDPNSPIGSELSPNGNRINIGAYGGTDQASFSPPWELHPLSKAMNPQPSNNAIDIEPNPVLRWTPGHYAVSHDVYLNTDFNDVNDATITNPLETMVSIGQSHNYYEPAQLEPDQTYYWRIDEVNESLITVKGNIWKFQTDVLFTDAYNPNPQDKDSYIPRYIVLTWSPGLGAITHDVYLGTNFNDVNDATITNPLGVLVSEAQEINSYDPDLIYSEYNQVLYWRVDETDSYGITTKGKIWSFETIKGGL